jgi:propanol-preferring alcohol dehydrogenase
MDQMLAMQIQKPGRPLRLVTRPIPQPSPGELLLRVTACGVCRTDLHVLDGDVPARYPIIPGHEIVGHVLAIGDGVAGVKPGQRLGVPWLGNACGRCPFCQIHRENLCDEPEFTGCTRDGGYATHVVADAAFCFALPKDYTDVEVAPLLCAGLIGWRALRLAGEGRRIGIYGFGAAGHIIAQVALWQGREVFAFTREGDVEGQAFARSLGCQWTGASSDPPPAPIDAALLFAPVGALVPRALKAVVKGGRVVCAGIHMSDIPSFPYVDLWGEREILSVANLTREDGTSFFEMLARSRIKASTSSYRLEEANEALVQLREGKVTGAVVLIPPSNK